MKILITGCAGFIGFSLANKLIEKKNHIFGIDNLDNYYSVKFKKKRVKNLNKNKNFTFFKVDIRNKKKLKKVLKNIQFDFVFHLAAQPGVRYSLKNPKKYFDVNVLGYKNLLNVIDFSNIKKFFYASSSSVYGDQKKFPTKENYELLAKNPYGKSKILNEQMSQVYSRLYGKCFIGLRFFSVYGEWGRPDMFIFKLLNTIKKNKQFELNNSGRHKRDLTHINDVVRSCIKLMKYKSKLKHDVFNICAGKSVDIRILKKIYIEKFPNAKIINIKKNSADVKDTYGCNRKLIKAIKIKKFIKFKDGILNSIKWFEKNSIEKFI
jgi:UDP-glucuronate 4-epimerase